MFRFIFVAIVICISGCASFKSTIMQRYSNGKFGLNSPEPHTKGVPVKLKVPTHIQVVIVEDFFVEKSTDGNNNKYCEIALLLNGKRIRPMSVRTEVIYTDKVFTVDFVRPAGGVLEISEMTFDEEQYFKKVTAEYEEKTLEMINTAIGNLTGIGAKASAATPGTDVTDKVFFEEREVARAMFDISEACWEDRLQEFVDHHVTNCTEICN